MSGISSRNPCVMYPTVSVLMMVPTPKRWPIGIHEQDQQSEADDDRAERQPRDLRQTLVQHVVGRDAETGADDDRDPGAEDQDARDEARQAPPQLATVRHRRSAARPVGGFPHAARRLAGAHPAPVSRQSHAGVGIEVQRRLRPASQDRRRT